MPGLFVALGQFPDERLCAAVRKLEHAPGHRSELRAVAPGITIGWAGTRGSTDHHAWSAEGVRGVRVWLFGHAFEGSAKPARLAASDVVRDYLSGGVGACYGYEGSFVAIIADLRFDRIYIVPDRLGTQPLYYTCVGGQIVIGPEVKALCTALGTPPKLSKDGLVGFLSAGYCIAAQTLFSDVHRLEMGKMIELEIDSQHRLTTRRFWKLEFNPEQRLKRADAEDALFDAIKDSQRLLLADRPSFQLLLSGGADSRGIIEMCDVLGLRPARAVTWGFSQGIPRSDASIAKSLAGRFGVPWDFIPTDTESFVENCEHWAYVSELSTDNFGWFSEGFGTLNYLQETGFPCSLIGDESWGWRDYAYSEHDAYSKVLPATVPAQLLALMKNDDREAASAHYSNNIAAIMRECHEADWNDRKDFLYLHGRVSGFIFALGYNRGHALEQRRPFLTRAVLDVVRRMPPELRVQKNLYLTMLKRRLPRTVEVPYASVNSLPDWNYDLRMKPRLRSTFIELLNDPSIGSGVLGDLIDSGRFRSLRDAFFAEQPSPVVRQSSATKLLNRSLKSTLWCSPIYKHVDRWANSRRRSDPIATIAPIDILRRIAVLVLLERQLNRFHEHDVRRMTIAV